MRRACLALVLCTAVSGCRFSVDAVEIDGSVVEVDMATGVDGAEPPVDMAGCLCATGCSAPPSTCLTLQPSGPVTAADYGQSGVAAITITNSILVDTDTGQVTGGYPRPPGTGVIAGIGFRVATQTSGPSVGVFSVAGFTLAGTGKITFKGANAFALASAGNVTVDGVIDASCSMNMPGPGGSAGGTDSAGSGPGAGKRGDAVSGASGGGGAGYGDVGGSGGLIATQTANGGVIWGDLVSPTFVLAGGSGGGSGGNMGGNGGGGGGAVMFAVNGTVRVTGSIDVGGCGGVHAAGGQGGGGAGSGGAIVLEAAGITLTSTAVLAANGGGGGAGDDKSKSGLDGLPSVTPAAGGTTMSNKGGSGGNGGASNGTPGLHFTNGRDGTITNAVSDFGGGGGGGVGRIALRAQAGGISDGATAVTPDAGDFDKAGGRPTVYGIAKFQ